jgi:hypothetical protein
MVQTVARLIFTPMLAIIYRQQLVVVEAQAQALPVNLVLPVVRVVVVVVQLALHLAARGHQDRVIMVGLTNRWPHTVQAVAAVKALLAQAAQQAAMAAQDMQAA